MADGLILAGDWGLVPVEHDPFDPVQVYAQQLLEQQRQNALMSHSGQGGSSEPQTYLESARDPSHSFGHRLVSAAGSLLGTVGDSVVSGLTAPHDAMFKGMTQEELYRRAGDLAGLLAPGPVARIGLKGLPVGELGGELATGWGGKSPGKWADGELAELCKALASMTAEPSHIQKSSAAAPSTYKAPSGVTLAKYAPPKFDPGEPKGARTSGKDYSKHLEEMNWADHFSPEQQPVNLAALPENLDRAQEYGFNLRAPLYKSMSQEFDGPGFWDPVTKPNERGVFFADESRVSDAYGHNRHLVYANPEKTLQVHWPSAAGVPYYNGLDMRGLIEAARKQNADMLVIRDIQDMVAHGDKSHTQHVVINPRILRKPEAEFNPMRLKENDLLAAQGNPLISPLTAPERKDSSND